MVTTASGSDVSRDDILHDDRVAGELRRGLLQPLVLGLERPHPLGPVDPEAAMPLARLVGALVRHAESLASAANRLALTDQHIPSRSPGMISSAEYLIGLDPSLSVPSFCGTLAWNGNHRSRQTSTAAALHASPVLS